MATEFNDFEACKNLKIDGKTIYHYNGNKGMEPNEFGTNIVIKGFFDREKDTFTMKGACWIEDERINYVAECDPTTVLVCVKPHDILIISHWRNI